MFHVALVETAEINPGCWGLLDPGGSACIQSASTNEWWCRPLIKAGRRCEVSFSVRSAHQPTLRLVLSPWKLFQLSKLSQRKFIQLKVKWGLCCFTSWAPRPAKYSAHPGPCGFVGTEPNIVTMVGLESLLKPIYILASSSALIALLYSGYTHVYNQPSFNLILVNWFRSWYSFTKGICPFPFSVFYLNDK